MYILSTLVALFYLFQAGVAPNIAERNPWNVEESTSFYERFHPSEYEPVMRTRVRSLLQEFEQVAILLETNCLPSPSLTLGSECRRSILRGGVLLRHMQSDDNRCIDMVQLIHEFRKEIGQICWWDDKMIIEMRNLLHQMHYELQRPWNRNSLMTLAHRWQEMPGIFQVD
jgi:hypothetical protein